MTQRPRDHEPFDLQRWASSVADRTVRLTAPADAEPGPAAFGFHPPEPVECRLCGEEVLPVGRDRTDAGHCPNCGFEHGSTR